MKPVIFTDIFEQNRLLISLPNTTVIYVRDWTNVKMISSLDDNDNGIRRLGYFGAKFNPKTIEEIILFKEISGSYLDILPDYVEMLRRLKKHFNIPKTYVAHDIHHYLNSMDEKKKYIIKIKNQARGVGKHFVTKDEFRQMLFETAYMDSEQHRDHEAFIKKYKVDTGLTRSETEKRVLYKAIKALSGECLVMQEETMFTHEFRILMFKNVMKNNKPLLIVEKRKGYRPGSEEERKHEVIDFDRFILEEFKSETLLTDIYEKLIEFNKDMPHCAVSLDLWINGDEITKDHIYNPKCWGMFEYSNEFGIDYPSNILSQITDLYSLGMLNYLNLGDCEDRKLLEGKIYG